MNPMVFWSVFFHWFNYLIYFSFSFWSRNELSKETPPPAVYQQRLPRWISGQGRLTALNHLFFCPRTKKPQHPFRFNLSPPSCWSKIRSEGAPSVLCEIGLRRGRGRGHRPPKRVRYGVAVLSIRLWSLKEPGAIHYPSISNLRFSMEAIHRGGCD